MSLSKIIDRLIWLGILAAAIVAVGIAGILALVIGIDHTRVGLVIGGALIVIIFVLLIYAGRHRRRAPHRPKPAETYEAEFAAAESGWFRRPSNVAIQSPQLMWRPLETVGPDTAIDTRPMRPVHVEEPLNLVEEPPLNPVEDTKPTHPKKPTPVYSVPTPGHGPYDDLFPPPQPGDEDYLEYDNQEATAKVATRRESPSLPPDEQPTVPIGPVVPVIEPPSARSDEPDQPEQAAETGAPEHPDQADSETPLPPENFPA